MTEPIKDQNIESMTQMFKMLADPTRLKILFALKKEALRVKDLSQQLGVEQSALSHQLAKLKEARLVKYERQGRNNLYSLDDTHVFVILKEMLDHSNDGES